MNSWKDLKPEDTGGTIPLEYSGSNGEWSSHSRWVFCRSCVLLLGFWQWDAFHLAADHVTSYLYLMRYGQSELLRRGVAEKHIFPACVQETRELWGKEAVAYPVRSRWWFWSHTARRTAFYSLFHWLQKKKSRVSFRAFIWNNELE